jgi:hypothetical protein
VRGACGVGLQWRLEPIGFVNEVVGHFVGELCDPLPVTADAVLGLVPQVRQLVGAPAGERGGESNRA